MRLPEEIEELPFTPAPPPPSATRFVYRGTSFTARVRAGWDVPYDEGTYIVFESGDDLPTDLARDSWEAIGHIVDAYDENDTRVHEAPR